MPVEPEGSAPAVTMAPMVMASRPNVRPAPAIPRVPTQRLELVQALRALAATMVVFGHLLGNARQHAALFGALPTIRYAGGAGVDIFFLISGFIMVHASKKQFGSWAGAAEFLRRRLIRIVPLYWLATAATVGLMAVSAHRIAANPAAILASFAFVPFNSAGRGDGMAFPILDLGWTLNYEMMFYVLFALFLPWGRRACVIGVGATLGAMVLIGTLADPANIALRFWTRPITLEFAAGMAVAMGVARWQPVWPPLARLVLVGLAISLYFADPYGLFALPTTPNEVIRLLGWGVPACLMLLAAVSGPVRLNHAPGRALLAVGDASYALYLLHPFILTMLLKLAAASKFLAVAGGWGFIFTGLLTSIGLAIAVHRMVETPLTRILLDRRWRPSATIAVTQ